MLFRSPGEEETSWQGLLARIRASAQLASASEQARADFMMVQKRWTAMRLTLVRGGYAQPRMLIRDAKATQPQWRCEAFRKPSGWLMPLYRLLCGLPGEMRRGLFPALDRSRRPVVEAVHRTLLSETLAFLRKAPADASIFRDPATVAWFQDPRWSRVECRILHDTWQRLLRRFDLRGTLARFSRELQIGRAHV